MSPWVVLVRAGAGPHSSFLGIGATRGVSARTLSASLGLALGLLLQQGHVLLRRCTVQKQAEATNKTRCQRAAAHVFFATGRLSMCPIGSHSRSHTSAVRMAVAA